MYIPKFSKICGNMSYSQEGKQSRCFKYRPVSILPSTSKIFEKEIVNQVEKGFSPYISGFRQRHCCETVLLRLVENIKKSIETGKVVCVVLMYFSRAYTL